MRAASQHIINAGHSNAQEVARVRKPCFFSTHFSEKKCFLTHICLRFQAVLLAVELHGKDSAFQVLGVAEDDLEAAKSAMKQL